MLLLLLQFLVPPELHVHQDKVEQIIGQEARLECRIRANPLVNHYWMKDGKVIETSLLEPSSLVKAVMSNDAPAVSKSAGKYEIFTYNQNSHEHLTISALIVKVMITREFFNSLFFFIPS